MYEAVDQAMDRTVALKLLPPHLADDAEFRARFLREAQTVARLNDPHVIPIHNFGEIDGLLYLDMRIVVGADLRSVIDDGRLPVDRAVDLISQIAGALDTAHESGLLHRDVKPENILLDAKGFAYLVDFGIAQSAGATRLTATGSAIGSFVYMAPERFGEHTALTPASDVYSLACVLYEAVTGAPPYPSTSYEQIITGHLTRPLPPTGTVLDPVIAAATAKDPARRIATCGEFAAAARAALSGHSAPTAVAPPMRPAQFPTHTPQAHTPQAHTPQGHTPQGHAPHSRAPRTRTALIATTVAAVALLVAGGAVWFAVLATRGDQPQAAPDSSLSRTQATAPVTTTVTATQTETRTAETQTAEPTVVETESRTGRDGDLGLSTPISAPPCDGRTIVVVSSVTTPGRYAEGVSRALADHPGAEYLRTDRSCSSLRKSLNGNPIYAVYFEGASFAETCALHARLGGDSNARRLDESTPPNTDICD